MAKESRAEQEQMNADEVDAYFDKLKQGQTKEKVAEINKLASGPAKETVKTILYEAINKGLLPRHALRLEDDTMEAIYSQAYNLYNQGKYKEASYVFRMLMMLDYVTPKYILGLAACLHRMKDYKNAANIYMLCSTLDATNPLPHYHSADCYLQLGFPAMAAFSLGMAIATAKDQPQYAVIKERARLMKETLDAQVDQAIEQKKAQEAGKKSEKIHAKK